MTTTSAPTLAVGVALPLRTPPDGSAGETYVLAVDLGTGGPNVAVVSATGRIAAHAFEKVGMALGADGGAEQTPEEWWNAIVVSARRALRDSGVEPERIVGIGCTSQWSGTVPIGGDGQAIGSGCVYPAPVKTIADQLAATGLTRKAY